MNNGLVRYSMILVRSREGVLPTGLPVVVSDEKAVRQAHIVKLSALPDVDEDDVTPGMTNSRGWATCCGAVFAPGTAEVLEWKTLPPHESCIQKSGFPPSLVQREHREARREENGEKVMPEAVAALDEIFKQLDGDWVRNAEGDEWVYDASFIGVFSGTRLFPRHLDIGLQPLRVELMYPDDVYIDTAGVRDGCFKHTVYTEMHSVHDEEKLLRRLRTYATESESIDLTTLCECLITGKCAESPLYDDEKWRMLNLPLSGH